jgi:dTDP-4-dehydrorhamnose reductase
MKVFVTGHRGMLGHVVARFLAENGYEVTTSEKRYGASPRDPLVEEIRNSTCTWIVNALGRIKQKYQEPAALFEANTLFPLHLKMRLHPDQRLIHASTDCIFSGRAGEYDLGAEPDTEDHYGLSKLLGESVAEKDRAYVLRTSIIGPEEGGCSGLMSWFLNQKGPVNGFCNHAWNGITTLEWSKVCLEIIRHRQLGTGPVWQVGFWPPITKFDILQLIGKVWNHPVEIKATDSSEAVDRSLKPTWLRGALLDQLLELRQWHSKATSTGVEQ